MTATVPESGTVDRPPCIARSRGRNPDMRLRHRLPAHCRRVARRTVDAADRSRRRWRRPQHARHAPTPGSPDSGDSLFPHAGNGGYDVSHYAHRAARGSDRTNRRRPPRSQRPRRRTCRRSTSTCTGSRSTRSRSTDVHAGVCRPNKRRAHDHTPARRCWTGTTFPVRDRATTASRRLPARPRRLA